MDKNFKKIDKPKSFIKYLLTILGSALIPVVLNLVHLFSNKNLSPYFEIFSTLAIILLVILLILQKKDYVTLIEKHNGLVDSNNSYYLSIKEEKKKLLAQIRENENLRAENDLIKPHFYKLHEFFIDFVDLESEKRNAKIKVINEYQKEYPKAMQKLMRRWINE